MTPQPRTRPYPRDPGDHERRLELVEQRLDRILDPEHGIYAKLDKMENRLRGWAIATLGGIILELVAQLTLHFH